MVSHRTTAGLGQVLILNSEADDDDPVTVQSEGPRAYSSSLHGNC